MRIHRIETDFSWQTATTDADGVARFPDVINGRYRIAGYRALSSAERANAPGGELAFGGGTVSGVSDGREVTIELGSTRAPGLVISEVYATAPTVTETTYDYHYYFEIYNNSGTSEFLDGMLFGSTLGIIPIDVAIDPCVAKDAWMNTPEGLWAHFIHRFPGSGSEYPIGPGETVLVALDAIDHSAVVASLPDLSAADFELSGSSDVDNPAVPNLPEVGIGRFGGGHGLRFFIGHTLFLAASADPSAFQQATRRSRGSPTPTFNSYRQVFSSMFWRPKTMTLLRNSSSPHASRGYIRTSTDWVAGS